MHKPFYTFFKVFIPTLFLPTYVNLANGMEEEGLLKYQSDPRRPLRILAIEGIGTSTIVPAVLLLYLKQQTGKSAWENFDIITASGSGAILGAGLSLGLPEEVMVNLLENHSDKIFKGDSKYGISSKEKFLSTIMRNFRISQTKADFLISFFDVIKNRMITTSTREALKKNSLDFYLKDLLLASTSLPPSISPHTFREVPNILKTDTSYCGISDSFISNSAVLQAQAYVGKNFPDTKKVEIYSLGAVISPRTLSFAALEKYTHKEWGELLSSINSFSHNRYSHFLAANMYNELRMKIFRINPSIKVEGPRSSKAVCEDTSEESIVRLHSLAYSQRETEAFRRIVEKLTPEKKLSPRRRIALPVPH